MSKISKRLLEITNHLDKTEIVLDIGCDHGLLAIYLVINNYYKKIYVSDNKQSALNNAINNINKFSLEEKIIPYLGNGLEAINNNEINTLIISGLGTATILKILNHEKLKQIRKIIIQSNNNHEKLRSGLEKLSYQLEKETSVFDNKKYYLTMTFTKGTKKLDKIQLKYGVSNDIDYYKYLKNKKEEIRSKIINKSKSNIDIEIQELETIIKHLLS